MDFPPDKVPSRDWAIRERLKKLPDDWFTVDLDPPIDNGLRISNLFVLSCDPNRLDNFMKNNSESGFSFTPYFGKTEDVPHHAIFDNYLNMLQIGFSDENVDLIGVVEDDVVFLDGSFAHFNKALSELPHGWDTLSGNLSMYIKATQKSKSTIKIQGHASSLNLTVFSKGSFLKIKEMGHLRDLYPHFDRFIFSPECGLNSFCSWPMVCREEPGYSINRGEVVDSFGPLIYWEPYKYWFINETNPHLKK